VKYLIILLFSAIGLATSCNDRDSKSDKKGNGKDLLLNFSTVKDRFKFENQEEFSIDTIDWSRRKNFYSKLDSLAFYQIYQDITKEYLGQHEESIDLDFYYSKQKSPRNLNELTILTQTEGEYCDRILYKIYDLKGKLISSFKVAGTCGDGGYYEVASGKFLNDSTYELFSEDNYKSEDALGKNTITFKRTLTTIRPNGTIVQSDSVLREKVE
jgi:hypothetical protein